MYKFISLPEKKMRAVVTMRNFFPMEDLLQQLYTARKAAMTTRIRVEMVKRT